MKQIILRRGEITYPNGQTVEMTTDQLIIAALDNPPEKGFSVSDIRARNRVADALKNAAAFHVSLEDADYQTLKKCVLEMRWAVRSEFIAEFIDQFD